MIFITLGSQKFQFNRLLKEIDNLIEQDEIKEEVFAQIGYSNYIPKNYKFKEFLDRGEFKKIMNDSDIVITHGGTGVIVGAIKQGKKVIAIPRLKKFNEHIDDHQLQIIEQFDKMKLIKAVIDIKKLNLSIKYIKNIEFRNYISNTKRVISSIDRFINL